MRLPQEMIPYNFFTYSISLSGKRIYIIGATNELSITNDLRAIRKLALLELDLETKKIKNYKLELGEFADEVLEFYFVAKDLAVMLTYDHRKAELVQYRMQIDKIKLEVCCDCIRHVKFEGPMGIRVGVGAVSHGYVLIIGKTSRELGEVCKIKMIASDPKYQDQFQDFDLDRPMIDLEQKAQMHPEELYLWPKSVPLLHNNSIYFLLAKKEGFSLIFDSSHLGCLIYNPKTNSFEPHIRGIDNHEIKALPLHPDMNINFGCMIAQKGKTMWLTFVSPASPRHWRWKLQILATVMCHAFLFVFGRFFIWFGQYDGGYMATKFMHFYLWLMGPTLIPEIGPSPTFRLAALDLEKLKLKLFKVKVRKSALSRFGQVLIDCDPRGDLVMTEVPPRCDDVMIHKIPNPFEPRPLCRITKSKVESEFPRFFLEKRLPPYLLESRSSTVLVPTWNLSTLLK